MGAREAKNGRQVEGRVGGRVGDPAYWYRQEVGLSFWGIVTKS
jgi:hypothetical protein